MKTYNEWGLDFIKLGKEAVKNEKTKEAQHSLNDIVYHIGRRPASPENAKRQYDKILAILQTLGEEEPKAHTVYNAWAAVGKAGKEMLKVMKTIISSPIQQGDNEDVQRLVNFTLRNCVQLKPELTPIKCINLLEDIKEIEEDYISKYDVNSLKLMEMKTQLVEFISNYYLQS